jgi:type III pantothenate kinase
MILAADIGNTNITLGVYETGRLRTVFRMKTDSARSADEYGRSCSARCGRKRCVPATCEAVAMVSVVPRVGEAFRSGVRMYMEMDPFLSIRISKQDYRFR